MLMARRPLRSPSALQSSAPIPMDFSSGEVVMAALLGLPSASFSDLARSLSSDLNLQRRRLAFLLVSPFHFALTLSYLRSLPLPQKTLLLARHLLSCLRKLLPSLSGPSHHLRLRDLDAALLLLAMCDAYDPTVARLSNWHSAVSDNVLRSMLSPSGLGTDAWAVVRHYVDAAVKFRRLMEAPSDTGDGEAGAWVAAVVALPSVECRTGGRECVICKDEMEAGRDVCELPCGHRFHWGCVLGWLGKRNTCPCCRHELPTEDVFCEMGRLWRAAAKMGDRWAT
ncbi:hypothetical protein GW17_00041091 [Ensete ventricosum]|uniref:RING-type domain-containing protein n=1 Tax=Ensete ventricosum TaxID=4639 RepID=A0A444DDP9_ENSVE|nr:hypothetical protein GW17_00041091 [Ensete ventricosum]RZR72921.1 hypothetical protein BHM03_00018617 [Ensete ventricosum]